MKKKGQIGIEYMIVVGFITLAIISVLGFSIFFSNSIKDRVRLNQAESYAVGLINSAEAVFFAGEPSKKTIKLYLPEGVNDIYIDNEYTLIVDMTTSSGPNIRAFSSDVPMMGTLTPGDGTRNIVLIAESDHVNVTEV